jgi:hypothetical protein
LGERACRRTPCAERAVILTAVQSLRLLVRRVLVGWVVRFGQWGSACSGR